MNTRNTISWVCSIFTGITALMSTNEVAQLILMILGIVSACISLAYNIYVWYTKVKSDKKISVDEVKELKDILDKGLKDIENTIDKENDNER